MLRRLGRAARFDTRLYREIRDDPATIVQAFGIVCLSALAFGLGIRYGPYAEKSYVAVLVWSFSYHFVVWVLLGFVVYLSRMMKARAKLPFLPALNGVGFAFAPGILYALLALLESEVLLLLITIVVLLAVFVGLAMAFRITADMSRSSAFLAAAMGTILMVYVKNDLFLRMLL